MSMSDLLKVYCQCWLFLVCFLWPKIDKKQNCTVVNCKWPKCFFSVKAMYASPWVYSKFIRYVKVFQKVKRKNKQKSDKEWITVGHIPDALVEILFPLMNNLEKSLDESNNFWKPSTTPEGKWVPGEGIEIPCNYELSGPKIHKRFVREKIKTVNVNQA